MELFRPDRPINIPEDDKFQRSQFAKRIAEICVDNKYPSSLVVGIYGKWGEGKTSVINMTQTEIGEKAVTINFNPWLFQDQGHLLKAFFSAIGNAVGKNLLSNKERALKLMGDYAEGIGAFADFIHSGTGNLIKGGKKIANLLLKDSLNDLKKKVDDLIIETDSNFIIFVDDIDRLDKQEIQVLFKMIKLVGDFPRTSYILAFDDEMVASALAPSYGGEGPAAGFAFLEKIIQIPLHLPQATSSALQKYTIELLNNCLQYLDYNLSEEDKNSFLGNFLNNILPAINNPRISVRLVNAIGFSFPLLKGEVNTSDLFIIECIKTIYPSLYHFIRTSPECFLTDYSNNQNLFGPTKEEKEKYINRISSELDKHGIMKDKLKILLISLFPQIRYPFSIGNWSLMHETQYHEKRICSPAYFQRYFSQVVPEGEISDVHFENVLKSLDLNDTNDAFQKFELQIPSDNLEAFVIKVRNKINWFSSNQARIIALIICRYGTHFTDNRHIRGHVLVSIKLLQMFSCRADFLFSITLSLFSVKVSSASVYISVEVCNKLKNYKVPMYAEPVIPFEKTCIVSDFLIERFNTILQTIDIFNVMSDSNLWAMANIYYEGGKVQLITKVLTDKLNEDSGNVIKIIKIFTPTISSRLN